MHTALNKTLAGLPDDTKVYNVKFLTTVLQTEPVKKLQSFAENNVQTQGKFTIADEKEYNAFMRMDVSSISAVCAHLNAFHVYADEPGRCVEANHYCTHLNEDVRQCLIYDTPASNARLIGVEYMISPALYRTLDPSERKLWHSHVYEVKSGMLIMPSPAGMPNAAWEVAETKEMEDVVGLYGKT
ncbi:MAG: hypothetical protein Q9193_002880, partial [Seirophora villosa]